MRLLHPRTERDRAAVLGAYALVFVAVAWAQVGMHWAEAGAAREL